MSRNGLLAIAIAVIVGVVIALVVITSRAAGASAGVAGTAASQVPAPCLDDRVELPEHGFAVTFPSEWTVLVGPEDWPTTEGRRIYTSAVPIFRSLLTAFPSSPDLLTEQCEMQSFAYSELTPFDIAYSLSVLNCGPGWSMPAHISLPAGEAAQLHCRRLDDGVWIYDSSYVLAADSGYVWLSCRGRDYRPDDRWLSIAETIELT